MHTVWEHLPDASRLPKGKLSLALVQFTHPPGTRLCGLPVRTKEAICWPMEGVGWYWSVEIEAAQKHLGAKVQVLDLWVARQPHCDCHTYDFVPDLYRKRLDLEREEKNKGQPLKLGLNSLVGKLAQRVGNSPYYDIAAAGLVTATVRAQLIAAIALNPDVVVMLATDAIFTTSPLPQLPISPKEVKALGLWSEEPVKPDLFIVQSGVYWSPANLAKLGVAGVTPSRADGMLKSRGLSAAVTAERAPEFERAFDRYLDMLRQAGDAMPELIRRRQGIPAVEVHPNVFISLRLASHWNNLGLAGTWTSNEKFRERCAARGDIPLSRFISFDWGTKRDPCNIELCGRSILTQPMKGDRNSEGRYTPVPQFGKPDEADDASLVRTYDIDGEDIDESVVLEGQPDWYSNLPEE